MYDYKKLFLQELEDFDQLVPQLTGIVFPKDPLKTLHLWPFYPYGWFLLINLKHLNSWYGEKSLRNKPQISLW